LKKKTAVAIIVLTLLLVLTAMSGCAPKTAQQPAAPQPAAQPPVALTIAAAESLHGVMKDVDALYMQNNPNVTITENFAGSGTLQAQIQNGAPIDVFISAAETQMNNLQKGNLLLANTRKDLLGNKVVLIVPTGSTLGITSFQDLANANVTKVAIGDPSSVPAGMYAVMVFNEDNIAAQVKPKEIMTSEVDTVLTDVETGNVDAGIVYATDAMASTKVNVVANAPDDINAKVLYPVAVIQASKNAAASQSYENFLFSSAAQAIFVKYGFSVK
jgi:molybdate transport system substrate-binding protein